MSEKVPGSENPQRRVISDSLGVAQTEGGLAKIKANERFEVEMNALDAALKAAREESGNEIKLAELKRQVEDCVVWGNEGRNKFADIANKDLIQTKALAIKREFSFK